MSHHLTTYNSARLKITRISSFNFLTSSEYETPVHTMYKHGHGWDLFVVSKSVKHGLQSCGPLSFHLSLIFLAPHKTCNFALNPNEYSMLSQEGHLAKWDNHSVWNTVYFLNPQDHFLFFFLIVDLYIFPNVSQYRSEASK